ncbi:MAG: hypothetical protein WCI05_08735 [Myxococcales bacterium]
MTPSFLAVAMSDPDVGVGNPNGFRVQSAKVVRERLKVVIEMQHKAIRKHLQNETHPGVTAVVPKDFGGPVTYAYLMPPGSDQLQRYVDSCLELKQNDGFTAGLERQWIDGVSPTARPRRWCVLRDVLHWLD